MARLYRRRHAGHGERYDALTGENRSLVADGVGRLHVTRLPGLAALAAQSRHPLEQITADELAYSLIPRLNSAGRMADPALALDLLMASDPIYAEDLAAQLESINQERRAIEAELSEEAMASSTRATTAAASSWWAARAGTRA